MHFGVAQLTAVARSFLFRIFRRATGNGGRAIASGHCRDSGARCVAVGLCAATSRSPISQPTVRYAGRAAGCRAAIRAATAGRGISGSIKQRRSRELKHFSGEAGRRGTGSLGCFIITIFGAGGATPSRC